MAVDFTRTRPNENRRPEFIELPDGRKRLTRFFDIDPVGRITDDLVEAYGTADVGDTSAPTAGFAGLRLIDQRLQKDDTKRGNESVFVKVYEELHATNENMIGQPTLIKMDDGRDALETEHWQFVAGAYAPGTVGTTTYSGDGNAYLESVNTTNDGTLRRIKRRYVYAGRISQDDQQLSGGKLLKRTIVSVKTVPTTPDGFTLVGTPVQHPDGLPVYSYTFYKGDGEIDRAISYGQSDDTGTTGSTTITITHLTPGATNTDPTSSPGAGFTKVLEKKRDEDGYRVWTISYAKGTGTVVTDQRAAEGGKIVVYHRVALGAAPATPDATIGGTVTATVTNRRKSDGYDIFDYTFVEGIGEVSRSTQYGQSSDQGATGSTLVTIRSIVAPGATVQPTSLADHVDVGPTYTDEDGYRVWVTRWAKGAGIVINDSESKNCGKLILYHQVKLGSAPSAPSATIGGTVTLIRSDLRKAEGYDVYDYAWAEGIGIIGERTQTRDGGLLLLNRDILVAPGATDLSAYTPAAGILVEKSYTDLDGYRRWSATWMQKHDGTDPTSGTAVATITLVPFTYPGRAKVYSVPFTTGGYTSHRARDMFLGPPVDCLVLADVAITYQTSNAVSYSNTLWNPRAWATVRARWIDWGNYARSKVEGLRGYRAVGHAATGDQSTDVITLNGGSINHNFADTDQVYFSSLTGGAGLSANTIYYVRDSSGSTLKLAATSGGAAINFTSNITAGWLHLRGGKSLIAVGDTSVLGERVYYPTDWELDVTGGPDAPDGVAWTLSARVDPEPAFIGYNGTKYYRQTVVSCTIPPQDALPV